MTHHKKNKTDDIMVPIVVQYIHFVPLKEGWILRYYTRSTIVVLAKKQIFDRSQWCVSLFPLHEYPTHIRTIRTLKPNFRYFYDLRQQQFIIIILTIIKLFM